MTQIKDLPESCIDKIAIQNELGESCRMPKGSCKQCYLDANKKSKVFTTLAISKDHILTKATVSKLEAPVPAEGKHYSADDNCPVCGTIKNENGECQCKESWGAFAAGWGNKEIIQVNTAKQV